MPIPVTIASRFCGPPRSGNGGYVAGLAAKVLAGGVEVTLRKPPPLERPLRIVRPPRVTRPQHSARPLRGEPGDTVELRDGDDVVAAARPTELALDVPPAPSFERAAGMSERFAGFTRHAFPTCFVCGPERAPGDGLRIFAGRAPGGALVGAPWIPDASLAADDGRVRPEFLWAALDCPGYFAVAEPGETAVLGRMAAEVDPTMTPGERCVVVAWPIARAGRKLHAGTALYDGAGTLRGRALQTWITI